MIEYFIKFVYHLNGFWKYLHFAIYWYNYKIFTNKIFNHLISISKWDFFYNFFFGVLKYFVPSNIYKNNFNVNLVEVQKHVVSKVIFVTIIFDHRNVFSP